MGRPAKSVSVNSKNFTSDEKEKRQAVENQLKGNNKIIYAPRYLNDNQKKIFKFIISMLKESDILGSLDVYILSTAAISIDRIQYIEKKINEEQDLIYDKNFMSAKDKYTKDFFRCCNELCLSPQSRAKLSLAKYGADSEEDPMADLLDDE